MNTYGIITTLLFVPACVGQAAGQANAPTHEQRPVFTMIISLKQSTVDSGRTGGRQCGCHEYVGQRSAVIQIEKWSDALLFPGS